MSARGRSLRLKACAGRHYNDVRSVRRRSEGRDRPAVMRGAATPRPRNAVAWGSGPTQLPPAGSFRRMSTSPGDRISQLLDEFRHSRDMMVSELSKVVIGQREVIEQILAAIFTRGHVLLVGVPGLARP